MSDFDISKHEFTDDDICANHEYSDIYQLWIDDVSTGDTLCILEKKDAIAIAKHFKLTAEDLE